jgi:hypothetical protein
MMRLRRRAAVLVTLSVLTSAATAHADCAWALWLRRLISVGCPSGVLNAGRLHRGDE